MSFSWLFMPWNPKISAFVVISVPYLRFSCDFLPRGESATFLLATMRAGLTSSDHMHRIASVCNPSDLFCTNKNSIGRPYASDHMHRSASDHMHRVASVELFCTNKNSIEPYEPHRIGCIVANKKVALSSLGRKWYETNR